MSAAHIERRRKLMQKLRGTAVLIAAGARVPRNYRANTYPFRASSHFLYLVGRPIENAMLLLSDGDATLFVPERTTDDALWDGPGLANEELATLTGCKVRTLEHLQDALHGRALATLAASDTITRDEQSRLLARAIAPLTYSKEDEALADAMIELRLVHDAQAIEELRRAAATTELAHRAGMSATRAGVRESDVRAAMEHPILADGGATAYGSIVTVHGEVLHSNDYDGTLAAGDLLLADVGAESVGGFAGDVTRTWPVSGRFSPSQRAYYEVVLRAQKRAIEAVKPGARYLDVHLLASTELVKGLCELGVLRGDPSELIAEGVQALFFPHGIGHLLGLDVHDMEDLGDRAGYAKGRTRSKQFGLCYLRLDRDLVPGMAVTIEPGLYHVPAIFSHPELSKLVAKHVNQTELKKYSDVRGIRIEDDVLVTQTGHEVLTRAIVKEAGDVERAVGAQS
ncbi:MAG: aminopeptidase P family protein [Sandaracinaceae bacterium]|nr:aminopeptidase P family protein [Sandaracinaceae bacterium]